MGLYYMNKEQEQFKLLIKSDLRIVERNWDSDDKADRLQAAYHMQQAIEKTIKLKLYMSAIPKSTSMPSNTDYVLLKDSLTLYFECFDRTKYIESTAARLRAYAEAIQKLVH